MAPALTVVVPTYNEGAGIVGTVRALRESLADLDVEVVVSDDGSTDVTAAEVEKLAASDPRVRLLKNCHKGRGAALKAGLAAASGEIVVTVDADLSYEPQEVRRLFEHLQKYLHCDLVIGSCYMPGGRTEGVPVGRLLVSRWGNVLLRFAFHGRFWTTTGILRGYRREKMQALLPCLVSDGKELYLESLHKAMAVGWRIEEIPADLAWKRGRGGGESLFSFNRSGTSEFCIRVSLGVLWSIGFRFGISSSSSCIRLQSHGVSAHLRRHMEACGAGENAFLDGPATALVLGIRRCGRGAILRA